MKGQFFFVSNPLWTVMPYCVWLPYSSCNLYLSTQIYYTQAGLGAIQLHNSMDMYLDVTAISNCYKFLNAYYTIILIDR